MGGRGGLGGGVCTDTVKSGDKRGGGIEQRTLLAREEIGRPYMLNAVGAESPTDSMSRCPAFY